MMVIDVNVLIAAHLELHPQHRAAKKWLETALSRTDDAVLVPDLVWVGFVRIVTNPRVFADPSTLDQALDFMRAVCEGSAYRSVPGIAGGLELFASTCLAATTPSRLITDAYIAAVALHHACPVVTYDRDFRRFDGLEILTPPE